MIIKVRREFGNNKTLRDFIDELHGIVVKKQEKLQVFTWCFDHVEQRLAMFFCEALYFLNAWVL